ncbi:hypothetical protein [Silvimonas iriomotensis]|uniref:hypothetical protein n=1 Tax=Silvimonas iriomotensis TaxID=449662 RepID=UPI00166977E8|nr:hypothetical protein [Silvimonas iriomotensis]
MLWDDVDLSIAISKLRQLQLEDGDLGASYWYRIELLLKDAERLRAENSQLSKELADCRLKLATPKVKKVHCPHRK